MGWDSRRLERLLFVSSPKLDMPHAVNAEVAAQYSYDKAFAQADRALAAVFAPIQPLDTPVEELYRQVMVLSADDQLRRAAQDELLASPQFIQYLVDSSHTVRYQDTERMLHLANLAIVAADACSANAAGGELRLADLRARAWGYYGNSLRVCARLREAEEAFARAVQECRQGTGDPLLRARLLAQKASLQIHQRQFENAIESAEASCQIYRELGDSHLLATSIILKANANLFLGETEAAVELLNRAIPLIDCESDPHLLLAACHNLVRCYIDLAQPEQALSIYAETQDLYREFGDPLILLRAEWQEGQLLRDMGHLRKAETRLLEAQKGFLERSLTYEAAVVSLDLAALYLKTGSIQDLRQTAAAAVPIFRALGVDREAIASLLQLQVADQEQQAMELIRFLNARIEPLAKRGLLK